MIYLSCLPLNARSRQVQKELRDPYQMHRTLSRAFGDEGAEYREARCLFRVDAASRGAGLTALVQSRAMPDWNFLTAMRDYLCGTAAVRKFHHLFACILRGLQRVKQAAQFDPNIVPNPRQISQHIRHRPRQGVNAEPQHQRRAKDQHNRRYRRRHANAPQRAHQRAKCQRDENTDDDRQKHIARKINRTERHENENTDKQILDSFKIVQICAPCFRPADRVRLDEVNAIEPIRRVMVPQISEWKGWNGSNVYPHLRQKPRPCPCMPCPRKSHKFNKIMGLTIGYSLLR